MHTHSRQLNPAFAAFVRRAPACLAVPFALAVASPAYSQDLHPDWAQVWNRDAPSSEQGTLTIPAGVVVPVSLDHELSSRLARVGDIVTATPISHETGDSEFPPGTRLGGVVSQAQPASGATPGVLDVDFQSALLPDGSDIPLHGFIASLDSRSVVDRGGRLIARDTERVNAWQAIGIGGGAGFVLGRLLKTRTLLPTILGATGAYLYARSENRHGEDARIAPDTTLGVRLQDAVSFPDPDGYVSARLRYLETHRSFEPEHYGWNSQISAPPYPYYPDYSVVVERPLWVTVDPFDYYGCPLVPAWAPHSHRDERPRRRDDDRFDWDDRRDFRPIPRRDELPPIEHFGDGAPIRPSRHAPDFGHRTTIQVLPRIVPDHDDRSPSRPFGETRPRRDVAIGRPRFDAPAPRPERQEPPTRPQTELAKQTYSRRFGWMTPNKRGR